MSKFSCDICFTHFNGVVPFNQHIASKKHQEKVQDFISSSVPSERLQDPFVQYVGLCALCRMSLNSLDQIKSHIHGGIHIKARSSIQIPKLNVSPQCLNQSVDSRPSNIPDPRIEINEYIDEVEKLVENIKVLVNKL